MDSGASPERQRQIDMSLFNELKRRNVFKVAAAYIIVGWLILQAGEVLAPALRLPEWINSALAFFLLLGFPLAMFFAWAFELTPEGLKKEKDVDRSQSITHVTGQKLNYSIIALLVVTLGYFAYDKFMLQPQSSDASTPVASDSSETVEDEFKTIAVLPFVNMSEDSSNEYFSDGLTEELLNMLAKIKELRVAGRTSSFAFKGKNDDLRVIGEKLNVGSILEGSVRKDDKRNRVRITVQLINVDDGYHLWSETYDRQLDDIFAIQEEIAREVAQALRITLLGEDEARLEQVASTNISAYDLYLQAMQGIHENGYVSLNNAVEKFQQVLALDPTFTPAKLGLIKAWTQLAQTGAITRQQAIDRGLPLLETLLATQPDNNDARIQLALFRIYQKDDEAAEKEFMAALEIDPRNAAGLQEFGRFLFDKGQVERGMELINAALDIEPYATHVLWDHCQTNAMLQNIDAALTSCNRIKEINPDSPLGYYGEAVVYLHTGDLARTAKGYSDAIERDPDDYEMLAAMTQFWLMLGDVEQAERWQQRADAIGAGQPIPIYSRLMLYKYREQHELARDLARQVLDRNIEDRFGSNSNFRQILAYESARVGDYQTALKPYRKAFPWAFETPLQIPADLFDKTWEVIQIAGLLKLAEPMSDRPEQLLRIAINHADQNSPGWGKWAPELNHAAIATIQGEQETALDWLNQARDRNWRVGWREVLLEDAIYTQLADEPGYQELVTRFETEMERQREVAYELMGIAK
jgi:TolB-like protein/Tfp pilus assembly protein PilF